MKDCGNQLLDRILSHGLQHKNSHRCCMGVYKNDQSASLQVMVQSHWYGCCNATIKGHVNDK